MKQHNHKQSFREYVVVEYHECLCTNRVDSKYFPAKISLTKTSSSLLFDYEIFEKKKSQKYFDGNQKLVLQILFPTAFILHICLQATFIRLYT